MTTAEMVRIAVDIWLHPSPETQEWMWNQARMEAQFEDPPRDIGPFPRALPNMEMDL